MRIEKGERGEGREATMLEAFRVRAKMEIAK